MDISVAGDLDSISAQSASEAGLLDASSFTHPKPAYQFLIEQSNSHAKQILNFVHNTESMMRVKDSVANQPPGAGDDEHV